MIAERHGRAIDIVEPFGCKFALGVVGLAATLPHIAGRQHDGVGRCLFILEKGCQLVNAGLSVRVAIHAVQVVDAVKVEVDNHTHAAIVALFIVVFVGVVASGRHILSALVAHSVSVCVLQPRRQRQR